MKCFVWLRQPISLFVSTEDWQEEAFELAHGTTSKSRSRPNVHVMFAKVLRRHLWFADSAAMKFRKTLVKVSECKKS
jgi:hypothetical protein